MLLGYVIAKAGLINTKESRGISVVMLYLVTPGVILGSFQVEYSPEIRSGLLLAFAAAILVHALFFILTALLKYPLQLDTIERATLIYTNAGILVIPLVKELLGQEYVIYSIAFIAIQQILLWTHCRLMLCNEGKVDWKKVFQNVNIIAVIVGLLMFATHTVFPEDVCDVIDTMGDMLGPLGMLLAGIAIAEIPLKTAFTRKRSYLTAMLRLLVYPILTLLVMKGILTFTNLTDAKQILLTVYFASITPACATVTSMAQLYEKDAPYASLLYVQTTLISILTMPVMVGLFENFI